MKPNKSFTDGVQVAWDSTSLELAQTCLRKYYYTMIHQIKPARKSVHLIFGGIYASALEHFYLYRAQGDTTDDALRKVIREALESSWNHEAGHPIAFEDTKKTRVNLIRTIVWYVDQFAEETEDGITTHHLSSGKPAVELSFAFEVDEDILLCGHLDRVVDYGGYLYVMDQKTTGGTVGPYYFEQFKTSNQMSLYSLAGRTVLESPVKGVIIDAAQIAINFSRFERSITTRTKDQLDEWYDAARHTISLAQSASKLDRWPQNFTACGNYGGCPFRELCSRSPSVRENFIKSDYSEHIWDPIQSR